MPPEAGLALLEETQELPTRLRLTAPNALLALMITQLCQNATEIFGYSYPTLPLHFLTQFLTHLLTQFLHDAADLGSISPRWTQN